jgi:hypothetical protein
MHTQEEILAAMSRIGTMVKGKVTVSRTAKSGRRYYSLQARRGGRNVTRYLAADKVAAVREATENYRRFMELVEQYVEASSRRLNL